MGQEGFLTVQKSHYVVDINVIYPDRMGLLNIVSR